LAAVAWRGTRDNPVKDLAECFIIGTLVMARKAKRCEIT
jgi:hypothetical protein